MVSHPSSQKEKTREPSTGHEKKLIVVRVRGRTGVKEEIADTLRMLKLTRINHAVIVPDTPAYRGMIEKVKDYVTFGNADEDTIRTLVEKKGEGPVFRLHPPRKGYEGIKHAYPRGALGNRGNDINELIKRML